MNFQHTFDDIAIKTIILEYIMYDQSENDFLDEIVEKSSTANSAECLADTIRQNLIDFMKFIEQNSCDASAEMVIAFLIMLQKYCDYVLIVFTKWKRTRNTFKRNIIENDILIERVFQLLKYLANLRQSISIFDKEQYLHRDHNFLKTIFEIAYDLQFTMSLNTDISSKIIDDMYANNLLKKEFLAYMSHFEVNQIFTN